MLTSHIREKLWRDRLARTARPQITVVPDKGVEAHAVNDSEEDTERVDAAS